MESKLTRYTVNCEHPISNFIKKLKKKMIMRRCIKCQQTFVVEG